jgi:hypothetical protein
VDPEHSLVVGARAELATCQLSKRMFAEQQACFARVPSTDSATQNGLIAAEYQYNHLHSAVSLYNSTISFLTDPRKFIFNSIATNSAQFAMQMFTSAGVLRPQYYSTANAIYAFAQNFAAQGMNQGMTGLPRAIALQSLEAIGNIFQASLADLTRATAMMDSIYISQNQYQTPSSNYSAPDSGTRYKRSTSNSSNSSGSNGCITTSGQQGYVDGSGCSSSAR